MKPITRRQLHEQLIYLALWLVVFIAPAVVLYLEASADSLIVFKWTDVCKVWWGMLPFLIIFLVHNYGLAPRLLLARKTVLYVFSVVLVLIVFQLLQVFGRPLHGEGRPDSLVFKEYHAFSPKDVSLLTEEGAFPPLFILGPDMMRLFIVLSMLGFNVAVKLFFRSQRDEERLHELEHHHLRRELEYLKYQINPHFFMNTLDNVHTLVDSDTARAKETISELSGLMRYIFYESSGHVVPLNRELEFLDHYVALMRLCYANKVAIETEMPVRVSSGIRIPPLLFISFIESAFQHGISYQTVSLVRLSLKVESNEVSFQCVNSSCGENENPFGGIGLENVCRRLRLLYGTGYRLHIGKKPGLFEVLLTIPVSI